MQAWIGIIAGCGLVVLAAAVTFGESDQARRLAGHAEELAASERVLASVATTRANLGVSVVLDSTSDLDPSLLAGASEAAGVTVDAAGRLVSQIKALDAMSEDLRLAEFEVGLDAALSAFVAGSTSDELEAAAVEMLDALDEVESEVVSFRDDTAAVVRAEGGRAGDLARTASYVVGLLGPALALVAYRRVVRRRLERIRREEALRRREEIAAAKVDLVAGLSHELRTPLTGSHGFSYTLGEMLDGPEDPDERALMRELAATVVDQTSDLSRLVDDLIAYMRLSDGTMSARPVPVKVADAVGLVVEDFSEQASFTVVVDAVEVDCDPIHLRHILRNLVSNAVKHGGPTIRVDGDVDGPTYRLAIVDDGPGLDPSRADPFAAFAHEGAKPLSEGSLGMGLGVVKGLVELSHGRVDHRRRDGWTVFEALLPFESSTVGVGVDANDDAPIPGPHAEASIA
jgi:signal transduction histidine kinase